MKVKEQVSRDGDYARFFLEILAFMEESLKREISFPVSKMCTCSSPLESYVRERFHEAFQTCSTSEKLDYFEKTLSTISKPPDLRPIENIKETFTISIRNFMGWGTSEAAKLIGFRFVTREYEIDLRRYLVR